MNSQLHIRDLWYPQAAAIGVPFARGQLSFTIAGNRWLWAEICLTKG